MFLFQMESFCVVYVTQYFWVIFVLQINKNLKRVIPFVLSHLKCKMCLIPEDCPFSTLQAFMYLPSTSETFIRIFFHLGVKSKF